MPRVSVIIATYNRSDVLRCAIRSVLAQSFGDFELLVVGDGCTDDSAAVVAGFADERVRWDNLEQNAGSQSAPNNRGLALARGRYVAFTGAVVEFGGENKRAHATLMIIIGAL
mgnify:CR=1 FL=1